MNEKLRQSVKFSVFTVSCCLFTVFFIVLYCIAALTSNWPRAAARTRPRRTPVSNANDVHSFLQYFIDKVGAVRDATAGGRLPCFASCPSGAAMTKFRCVTVEEVIAAVRKLPDKSCALDVLPTPQLKPVADLIAPFLCELFHRSLTTATVPEAFKFAYVTPRLKKHDLDTNDVRSLYTDRYLTCR